MSFCLLLLYIKTKFLSRCIRFPLRKIFISEKAKIYYKKGLSYKKDACKRKKNMVSYYKSA
jgi:hypothetical protein